MDMRCVENVTNHTFKYLITLKYFTDQKLCIGAWNCTQIYSIASVVQLRVVSSVNVPMGSRLYLRLVCGVSYIFV